jgi:hypothetical protein
MVMDSVLFENTGEKGLASGMPPMQPSDPQLSVQLSDLILSTGARKLTTRAPHSETPTTGALALCRAYIA